ncbi:conserved hypothetical protein [Ricinus communis]|uniref:Uncharacterized protein n=1 Tax=Ricinus communis TaxID=3988 RepID=B9SMG0_RICCO|nr:conserved hypothetical protein [Ricinus communis]
MSMALTKVLECMYLFLVIPLPGFATMIFEGKLWKLGVIGSAYFADLTEIV